MDKTFTSILVEFFTRLFTHPQAEEIFIRVFCVTAVAMGIRNVVRFCFYMWRIKIERKKTVPQDFKDFVNNKVKGYLIPSSIAASTMISFIYRNEFLPTGVIYVKGVRVKTYELVALETEHIIGEGIMYGLGSIGFLFVWKGVEIFMRKYLGKKVG